MSRTARYAVGVIVVLAIGLEVWAYIAYRNATDGVFVNAAILIYTLIAIGVVKALDVIVRRWRRQRHFANPS